MPTAAHVLRHPDDNGYLLVSPELGPYFHRCPLELVRVSTAVRGRITKPGSVWHINANGSPDDYLRVFNEWYNSLRTLTVYAVRERNVETIDLKFNQPLRGHDLRLSSHPDVFRVPVPPEISDNKAFQYVVGALGTVGYAVEAGTIGDNYVAIIRMRGDS